MQRLLAENPLLLLFVIAAVGYPLGQVRIAGTRLGVGAVLFAGLAIGSIDPAYATVHPVATIAKVLLGQVLLALMR